MSPAPNANRRIGPPRLPPELLSGVPEGPPPSFRKAQEPAPPPRPRRRSGFGAALKSVLGLALVVSTSVAVAGGARHYLVTTPRFAVSEVRVTGQKRRTVDDVRRTAGLEEGVNVFTVDLDAARARLLDDPWIADAELARRLPGTLLVQIKEREAMAIAALPEAYLLSRDGEIMKRLEAGDPSDLPVITGVSAGGEGGDPAAVRAALTKALDVAMEYERTGLVTRHPLQEIHLAGDGSVSLVVGKQPVTLALGDAPFRRKLDQAVRIFAELDKQSAKPEALMLDNEARPDRVVVRMR